MYISAVYPYQKWFPQFANVFYGEADPLTSMAKNIPSFAYVNNNVNLQ